MDRLEKVEKDKAALKKTSSQLIQKVALLKTETDKIKNDSAKAMESPWESEDFEGADLNTRYECLASKYIQYFEEIVFNPLPR